MIEWDIRLQLKFKHSGVGMPTNAIASLQVIFVNAKSNSLTYYCLT